MADKIRVDFKNPINGEWDFMQNLTRDLPCGSMSSYPPKSGRQIFVFGWFNDEGPCLWRSGPGFDEEIGFGRMINTTALIKVCDLSAEPNELTLFTPFGERTVRLTAV